MQSWEVEVAAESEVTYLHSVFRSALDQLSVTFRKLPVALGFHVIYIPYAEDMRDLSFKINVSNSFF